MKFVSKKKYKETVKKKGSLVICAPYEEGMDFDCVAKCSFCKADVVHQKESLNAWKYACPACGLKFLQKKKIKNVSALESNREMIEALKEHMENNSGFIAS